MIALRIDREPNKNLDEIYETVALYSTVAFLFFCWWTL